MLTIINSMLSKKIVAKVSSQIGHAQQNMKKFYKEATFKLNPKPAHPLHKYIIYLDNRTVKTGYMHLLAVPTKPLALMLTNQFNRQGQKMKTSQMPLLGLCRTSVDCDIETHLSQNLRSSVQEYLKTDTLLFEEQNFIEDYNSISKPLIKHFADKFGMDIKASNTLQPPKVSFSEQFKSWLNSRNSWQLIGMQTMTIWMKSTICAFNIISNPEINADQIQKAAYLQEMYQMKTSGEVQEKLMDQNSVRLMVSCGQMMYRFGSDRQQKD